MKFLDLFYPPICLHCKELLKEKAPLCPLCLSHLDLLLPEGRCHKCFHEIGSIRGVCNSCRLLSHPLKKFGSCFDAEGPAPAILIALNHQGYFHYAKSLAAWMFLQIEKLGWPTPQAIVPLPEFFQVGGILIGKELAKLCGCPYMPVLKKKWNLESRFTLKKRCNIINKVVLLVDLKIQSLDAIHAAAWTLHEGGPEALYGMTFCVS